MNLPYLNTDITSMDGEEWIDCIGFDGYYSVSNLGRVKSEGRWVSNGKSERFVKPRILSQAKFKDGRLGVSLSVSNIQKPCQVNQLVYYSFNPEVLNDSLNDEVYHKNKIQCDNRLLNLGYNEVHGASYSISINLGNVTHLEESRKALHHYTSNTAIVEDGVVVKRKCRVCGETKSISCFERQRNTCLKCRSAYKKAMYKKKFDLIEENKE